MIWTITYKKDRISVPTMTVQFHAEHFLEAAQNAKQAIWFATGISPCEILKLEQGYGEAP